MNWTGIALLIQLFFGVVIGVYFWNLLKSQRNQKVSVDRESKKRWSNYERCVLSP
ncbi:ATP-dependent protease La LonB Type I [Halalkalibacter hemicellulosilyticusJCM 9152]|uniref:ATP-dependent protease La LonB Type I n=1 Tax=Halalkalibacter hemicellulosilyticusJCM 9152 TaxID=1236971 RepID=W4QFR1_9BACI|nr:ATP-dependent protease La LonB Type I [Halalkalibacter hemicellulosilyticusJCM 9152]